MEKYSKHSELQTLVRVSYIIYDSIPQIEWQKCYGGSSGEEAWSIQQTNDGGYIIAGI